MNDQNNEEYMRQKIREARLEVEQEEREEAKRAGERATSHSLSLFHCVAMLLPALCLHRCAACRGLSAFAAPAVVAPAVVCPHRCAVVLWFTAAKQAIEKKMITRTKSGTSPSSAFVVFGTGLIGGVQAWWRA
jgi:hypothetical protein